jgi:hypothetical protein
MTDLKSNQAQIARTPTYKKVASPTSRMFEASKDQTGRRLGPGYYMLPETDTGQVFEFPLTSRFQISYDDRLKREL